MSTGSSRVRSFVAGLLALVWCSYIHGETDNSRLAARTATVEEILNKDPLLLGDEVEAMVEERKAALATILDHNSLQYAETLIEYALLESQVAQAAVIGPTGGVEHSCNAFLAFREALAILSANPSASPRQVIEAQLRYAELLSFSFCLAGPDCDLVSTQAIDLAAKALAGARRIGASDLTSRALNVLAEVRRGDAQRLETGYSSVTSQTLLLKMMQDCLECDVLRKTPDGLPTRGQIELEEAVRIELKSGVWTRGLVDSLVRLAFSHWKAEDKSAALSLANIAASGSAALLLREDDGLIADIATIYLAGRGYPAMPRDARMVGSKLTDLVRIGPVEDGMSYVLMARISATIHDRQATEHVRQFSYDRRLRAGTGAPGIHLKDLAEVEKNIVGSRPRAKPSTCEVPSLRAREEALLLGERRILYGARQLTTEREFRMLMGTLSAEDQLLRDVALCDVHDQQILKSVIERVLLRRQIWRYRFALLARARATGDASIQATAAKLVDLRRRRAEQRLRRIDPAQSVKVTPPGLCLNDESLLSTEAGVYLSTEMEIASVEGELTAEIRTDDAETWNVKSLLDGVVDGLGSDGVLVVYLPVDLPEGEHVLIVVVDGSGNASWVDGGAEAKIDAQVRALQSPRGVNRNASAVFGPRPVLKTTLRSMAEVLFDPIEPRLQETRRVFVLASGASRLLPWSALIDRRGRYLGSRFAVSSVHWAGDISPVDLDRSRPNVTLVAPKYPAGGSVGDFPRIVPPAFAPLQWSSTEVKAIKVLLKARHVDTETLDGEVTEEMFRAIKNPTVLHVAAHGFRVVAPEPLGGDDPDTRRLGWYRYGLTYISRSQVTELDPSFARVGIALSRANQIRPDGSDDLLTAVEAADLDLRNTRLVVLSGCDTGVPSLQDSSGAYDLALGFRMAGATAVIASLWDVEDRATELLMKALYANLLPGVPVVDALWRAKDALRRGGEFSDPRYWAGFEVFGPNVPVW